MTQKRFLSATPSELTAMTPVELLSAIRMSEGRIIRAAARIRGANMIDHVTNAELAAAFGADKMRTRFILEDMNTSANS